MSRAAPLLLGAALALALPAMATESPAAAGRDQVRIEGQVAAGMRGAAAMNLAAGVGNAQANVRALGQATQATVVVHALQHVDTSRVDAGRDAQAVIAGGALADFHGVLGLNQAAGGANAQANVLAVGIGAGDLALGIGQQVDNAALAATAANAGLAPATDAPAMPLREARIEPGAIGGASGVLQINQSAGVGNASANAIVLQLPGSTP